ncbi:MAG: hypothetical protein R3183_08080 [Oleiphilaceae bacterium]|nr:hypothetical protein [Oleiphilaceae bacterium]
MIKLPMVLTKTIALMIACLMVAACSTTPSNVRAMIDPADVERVQGTSLYVGGGSIQTSSQGDVRIFKLHHAPDEIVTVAETVARAFGFHLAAQSQADYHLVLKRAAPDGGACIEGWAAAGEGASFTASVLTLGILPARGGQCLEVTADLFVVLGGEAQLLAEFVSNAGKVNVVAGARDVDRYRSSVERSDELRALEASIGGMLQTMIRQGAFD